MNGNIENEKPVAVKNRSENKWDSILLAAMACLVLVIVMCALAMIVIGFIYFPVITIIVIALQGLSIYFNYLKEKKWTRNKR